MTTIQWYPGHMAKTKRLIKERLHLVDVVYELLDARAPYSSQNPMIREITIKKPRLILLNKADLAERHHVTAWINHFRERGFKAIAINSLKGLDVKKVVQATKDIMEESFVKSAKRGIKKRPIRAMILGIPNVGKSTLINQLVNKRATNVGDVAGITKHLQMIRIHEDLELLDTPGILWPKFEDQEVAKKLVLLGSLKDSVVALDDVVIYGFQLLKTYYKDRFEARYDISVDTNNMIDIFDAIGMRRGCLKKGGEIDYDRVIDIFLYDFRNQYFGPITLDRVNHDV
ncbi:MAG: ribosome biogenesis GTPase YlqF [Bacillota bacterium]